MNQKYNIPFQMPEFPVLEFGDKVFEVKDYYAEGDEKRTIQKAVDACAQAGGGTVLVNAGEWLSGPIHLASNICLHLEEGALVRFSDIFEDYLPVVFTRWEGMECYNYSPLIYSNGCENIKVSGKGRFYGSGAGWWSWKQLQASAAQELCYAESEGIPVKDRIYGTVEAALRPSLIQFINCKNIEMEDFTVEDGPQWTVHPVYCENLKIVGVNIKTTGPNTDGLNPDSCKNVWIEKCTFSTGDDCIAINSGMNEDGWRVNKPCENVVIVDCDFNGGHGGIVIGSGMSGGVKNVYAANCRIGAVDWGIRLKSMKGRGGYVRDVWVEDVEISGTLREAIQITMYYPYTTVEPKNNSLPEFSHIYIDNVRGYSDKYALLIRGLPEKKLTDIKLSNIKLKAPKACLCDCVENLSLDNVEIEV